jgi:hypothetical protein
MVLLWRVERSSHSLVYIIKVIPVIIMKVGLLDRARDWDGEA